MHKTPIKYELELAISAKSELDAVNKLAKFFGDEIKNEIELKDFSKYSNLFFIKHSFYETRLSDDCYEKILNSKKIFVISDKLSTRRSVEILEVCLPIEVQLKKLLIYTYTSILPVLNGRMDDKSWIESCKQISNWTLGDLLGKIEIDLSQSRRQQLFMNDGRELIKLLEESNTFDDFKKNIEPYISKNIVWDQICAILQTPIKYELIKEYFQELRQLRNKAAHPQLILNSDVDTAKKCAFFISGYINKVKNNYNDELTKSLKSLSETMNNIIKALTPYAKEQLRNSLSGIMPNISESIQNATKPITESLQKSLMNNNDWLGIDSIMRESDPEYGKISDRFRERNMKDVIDDMNDELLHDNNEVDDENKN